MRMYSIIGLILLGVLIAPFRAMALTIDDTGANAYWGGLVGNSQPSSVDVIGTGFALDGMNVFISGSTMTVQVIGPYFSNVGSPNDDGDLYISSTGWHVSDTAGNSQGSMVPSASDTFKTDGSEGWDYVVGVKQVRLPDRAGMAAVPGVYKLMFANTDPPSDNAFQFTTGGPGSGGRALQAYRGGYGDFAESATITPDYANSMLTYTFFLDPSFFPDPTNMGFHWTMYCGNDVVEGGGSTHVPEPGSLLLLGLGLAGLRVYRRNVGGK